MRYTDGGRYDWPTALVVTSLLLAGCSVHRLRTAGVGREAFRERAIPPPAGENPAPVEEIDAREGGDTERIAEGDAGRGVCRVKYHPSYRRNRWMVVTGTLGPGRTYPVILDTGASPAFFVNDIHILEEPGAVRPRGPAAGPAGLGGTCLLPRLQIADFTLLNWPCHYAAAPPKTRFCGLPVAGDQAIIAGVPVLRRFRYLLFDNVAREVEFSRKEAFECECPQQWSRYPLTVEEDFGGNAFLFVEMPVAGRWVRLQLDTGSGRGLALAETTWREIRARAGPVSLRKTKELYPYLGRLDCRRGVIPRLHLGSRIVNQAELSVFSDDSLLLEQATSMLGMQCFQDTTVVLDFQRERMWVKNPARASSRS